MLKDMNHVDFIIERSSEYFCEVPAARPGAKVDSATAADAMDAFGNILLAWMTDGQDYDDAQTSTRT